MDGPEKTDRTRALILKNNRKSPFCLVSPDKKRKNRRWWNKMGHAGINRAQGSCAPGKPCLLKVCSLLLSSDSLDYEIRFQITRFFSPVSKHVVNQQLHATTLHQPDIKEY